VDETRLSTAAGVPASAWVSDRPPFGAKDDIRRDRKAPDRNILDRDRIVDAFKQWGIVLVFLALIVIFTILRPATFPTLQNAINILNNSSTLVLFSVAATIALVVGEFDLSFPAVADLVAIVVGVFVTTFGWSPSASAAGALLVGLAIGTAIGAVNGLFVAKAFVPSFVATLADCHRTTPGRQAYATGGNPMAAYLAGVPVAALRIAAFSAIGAIAALSGGIQLSERGYFNMASPPLLLQAYTAAFLGAAVLAKKKRFDAFGSVFSVFVLLVLSNGLSLMNQPRWIASVISGAVLLVAVLLNRPQGRKV